MPCFNTVTRLPAKMDSHQPRSCLAILSRTHSPHTAVPLRQRAPKKQNNKALRHWNNQKYSTTYMPDICIVNGTVVAIGPHRRYYIKTHSGRVLVRNRRFLRRCIPASLQPLVPACYPSTPNQHTSPPANSSPPPASPESTIHTHSL